MIHTDPSKPQYLSMQERRHKHCEDRVRWPEERLLDIAVVVPDDAPATQYKQATMINVPVMLANTSGVFCAWVPEGGIGR